MIDFDAVLALIAARGVQQMIAIDGLPVSGKSTLADRLAAELGATCLFLDDFVIPEAEWRGTTSPAFPFPYIRYGAFFEAVASLGRGEPARFRRYDWQTGAVSADLSIIRPEGLVVVEGVSALHTDLAPLYDLRLWIESDGTSTLAAALARGANGWEDAWRDLFLPSVALYLETAPRQRADLIVAGRGAAQKRD